MKYVFVILGLLVTLLAMGYFIQNGFFTGQVVFILIFAVIMLGGWALLKFIQKQ